MKLTLLQVI